MTEATPRRQRARWWLGARGGATDVAPPDVARREAAERGEAAPPLLRMRGVRKRFSGVEVLRGIDLSLDRGEVLAIVGANGAGKSTLIKILGGEHPMDAGEIAIEGRTVEIKTPRDAERAGVAIIPQEPSCAMELSVAENILMGHLPTRPGWTRRVDWDEAVRRADRLLASLETNSAGAPADIDPAQPASTLGLGKLQLVAIARAMARAPRILVFDEPTAALTPSEAGVLLDRIAALRAAGVGVVYISHRLDEIERVAQRIVVLRDGSVAREAATRDVSRDELARMIVGERPHPPANAPAAAAGRELLSVVDLSRRGAFEGVSFALRAGEIVGLFGLLGAGQMDVARVLFGVERATSGEVRVLGERVDVRSPRMARSLGIGFVPEDRLREALLLDLGVAENITLANLPGVSRLGVLQRRKEREHSATWVERLGVDLSLGLHQPSRTLSGGNQQKVVLARWLEARSRLLILCEPTRGVDVGARAEIHAALRAWRAEGLGVLLVSSDVDEVLALSDRVLVFSRGRLRETPRREPSGRDALLVAAAEGAL